ncbi:hypothetical protein AN3625.2 [Aspergillus nidulans FGSC A4]|nr:hypothetical protein AN3625.2 [Aspergillus nidulans FGSC A4]|eukprot:XP_661229.1 hypothetical protein AN3625.2 [Aspergillus nidulans FGSC A4]
MPEMPAESSSNLPYQQQYLNLTTSSAYDPNPVPSSSNKENAAPSDLRTNSQPPPSDPGTQLPSSTERIPDSLSASQAASTSTTLPAPLLLILQSIQSTLRSLFSSKPPHTIQRLAELILRPNAHYRTLPAYMRALDRVVSVTSTADVFPFPMQSGAATAQPNGTLNGAQATFSLSDDALGSDEALGGALLTPIPWLNNASSPEPEGTGISEVSIVTTSPTLQNQLLSQPADLTPQEHVGIGGNVLEGETPAEPTEEVPHARGPSVLGVEDMGLQDGKGVEMTLQGKETKADAHSSTAESSTLSGFTQESVAGAGTTESAIQGQKDEDAKPEITTATADGDGDITLSDEPHISQKGQDEKK